MDHLTFAQLLGNYGEFFGALAVVVSFLYLGRQIAVSNKQTRASARYAFLEASGTGIASITASKESASVFRRGLGGDRLDDDEWLQFAYLFGALANTWTVLWDLYEEGLLPANQWFLTRKDIIANLNTPGGRDLWERLFRHNYTPEFVAEIEKILDSEEVSYDALVAGPSVG